MEREQIYRLLFGDEPSQRFTQDSPILPEVWVAYLEGTQPHPVDLLLNPHRQSTSGALHVALKKRLEEQAAEPNATGWRFRPPDTGAIRPLPLVYSESHVVAHLWLDELIRGALPLTQWWRKYVWRRERPERIGLDLLKPILSESSIPSLKRERFSDDFRWLLRMLGYYALEFGQRIDTAGNPPAEDTLMEAGLGFLEGMTVGSLSPDETFHLWSVSTNRPVTMAMWVSTSTVKADAARNLFRMNCKDLCWGIVDSGIDATHPAFVDHENAAIDPNVPPAAKSRVRATYDFTKLRVLLDGNAVDSEAASDAAVSSPEERRLRKEMRRALASGRAIDWGAVEPLIRVLHDATYPPPMLEHGTHVAGILAANWRREENLPPGETHELIGMCPDIQLYDLRVINDKGEGDEFTVMAALQFVRHMNAHKDLPVIHGVNLSLSLQHDVTSYACGRTPVCEECARLVGNGVVVVVAAGNKGYSSKMAQSLGVAEYQDISITDPGNAEAVITVGSTHRGQPHTYGVSYFSSRGPTGDGRMKPDLVAPGEKVKSAIPGGQAKSLDGTSMAAPHVSGAAALLMARNTEFIGEPARIKAILCSTTTDLGRERVFQGAGLVDVLRALQSV